MTDDRDSPNSPGGDGEDGVNPAQRVIQRFGGIRPMATKLGVAVSTVQGWKNRGAIPPVREVQIREAAERHGIDLDPEVLEASRDTEAEDGDAVSALVAGAAEADTGERASTVEVDSDPEEHDPDERGPATIIDPETGEGPSPEEAAAVRSAAAVAAEAAAEHDAPESPEAAAAPPPPPPRVKPVGWVPGMLLGAALAVVVAGGTVVLRDQWLPLVTDRPDAQPPGLAKQVAELDQRTQAVQQTFERVRDLPGRFEAVRGRVEQVQQDIAELREREVPDPARVEALAGTAEAARAAVQELSTRTDELAGRLESAVGRVDELGSRADALAERVSAVEESSVEAGRLDKLAQRLDKAESELAALTELRERMAARANVEDVARSAAASQVGRIMAVTELRDSLRFNQPFAAELQAARSVLPEGSEVRDKLAALEPRAGDGIPTRARLTERFRDAARDAVGAAAAENREGLFGGVLERLNNVIGIRPVEPTGSGGAADRLAKAERQLEAGDLAGALTSVERLSGEPAEAMAGWRADARARVRADQTGQALGRWLRENARALQQAARQDSE